ncbi:hypothetical protein WBP06_07380 [Novosphingobium sp. BL-8H]|uniref:hypothetical protein n=1 Tax=Novosphingobium sp. BL-8H TaxID=3127640 RepID=UPI0037576687
MTIVAMTVGLLAGVPTAALADQKPGNSVVSNQKYNLASYFGRGDDRRDNGNNWGRGHDNGNNWGRGHDNGNHWGWGHDNGNHWGGHDNGNHWGWGHDNDHGHHGGGDKSHGC